MKDKRPFVGVGVVVMQEDRVLMGKRKGSHGAGLWCVPGGHLEYKETVEDCAKRELLEETGLIATELALGPWVDNVIEDKHYITLFVLVPKFEGTLKLLEPHKCEGWEWFPWENLPSPLFPTITTLLQKI